MAKVILKDRQLTVRIIPVLDVRRRKGAGLRPHVDEPKSEVLHNFSNNELIMKERNNPHRSAAVITFEGIDFVYLPYKIRPFALGLL